MVHMADKGHKAGKAHMAGTVHRAGKVHMAGKAHMAGTVHRARMVRNKTVASTAHKMVDMAHLVDTARNKVCRRMGTGNTRKAVYRVGTATGMKSTMMADSTDRTVRNMGRKVRNSGNKVHS